MMRTRETMIAVPQTQRATMGGCGLRWSALLLAVLLALALPFGFAVETPRALAATSDDSSGVRYANPDTGCKVVILDDSDLLNSGEEEALVEDMKPITAYGNVAFWSTDERARDEIEQARLKRKGLFEYSDATIFVINMANRKLTIQSYGKLYSVITDSRARSITDNASSYATSRRYYAAARQCYSQMNDLMDGYDIPEPMKLTGYAVLAVILGLTITLAVAFSPRNNPLRVQPQEIEGMTGKGTAGKRDKKVTISEKEFSASSGGGGGGGCGGGGCGGGCGGGGSSGF